MSKLQTRGATLAAASAQPGWRCWAAAAILFVLFTRLSDLSLFDGLLISPNQLLIGLLLALLAIDWLVRGRAHPRWDRLLGWMLLYGLALCVSSLAAPVRLASLAAVVAYLRDVLIVLGLLNLLSSAADLRLVSWALLAAGLTLIGATLVEITSGQSLGGLSTSERAHLANGVYGTLYGGSIGDSNFFAQQLVMLVPLALYRFWDERRALPRLLAAAALGLLSFGLLLTFSRGGLLALLTVMVIAAFRQRRRPARLLTLGLILLGLALGSPELYRDRLSATIAWFAAHATPGTTAPGGDTEPRTVPPSPPTSNGTAAPTEPGLTSMEGSAEHLDASLDERSRVWRVGALMFAERPLSGIGAGNYRLAYPEYARRVDSTLAPTPRGTHSTPVEVAAESGLLGLAAFAAVVVVGLMGLWQAQRSLARDGNLSAALTLEALELAAYGYLVTSLFLNNNYPRYLWIILGLGAVGRQLVQRSGSAVPTERWVGAECE